MKTLIILAVILGILFLYFVVRAEKSLIIKGNENEAVPGGIDIPNLILGKAKELKSQVVGDNILNDNDSGLTFINNTINDAKNLVSQTIDQTIDKISESIKNPIENKINEVLCPKE